MKPAGWNRIQLVHQISWNVFVLMIPNSGLLFGNSGVIMITFGQTIIYHENSFSVLFHSFIYVFQMQSIIIQRKVSEPIIAVRRSAFSIVNCEWPK